MNKELTIFEGIELEVLTKEDVKIDFNGEVLFNGRQVAEILEYAESSKPLRNIRENQKIKIKNLTFSLVYVFQDKCQQTKKYPFHC